MVRVLHLTLGPSGPDAFFLRGVLHDLPVVAINARPFGLIISESLPEFHRARRLSGRSETT